MSERTGRPKKEGGHHRVDITVDWRTLRILSVPDNRSDYVENCVDANTATHWITFQQHSVTVNEGYRTPQAEAAFFWPPCDCENNAIVATYCVFEHKCEGRGFMFRLRVNGDETSHIMVEGSPTWSLSPVYTDWSFAQSFEPISNQNLYTIEIQFEPLGMSDRAYLRDIMMFLEVVDGLRTM